MQKMFLGMALFYSGIFPVPSGAEILTLRKAYELAARRSESLQIGAADLDLAKARLREIRGATLPQLSLRLSEQVQDASSGNGQGSVASSFLDSSKPEAKLHLGQALFSGFQDLAVLAAARHERRVQEFEWEQAKRALAGDLALVFYTVFDRQQERASLEELLLLTQDREKELSGRVSLGRSRRSELIAVELQLRNIEADKAGAAAGADKAAEMLSFLLGETPGELEAEPDAAPAEAAPGSLDQRPDLVALEAGRDSSERRLAAARRARWPLVRAEGNYYLHRTGLQENVAWDALLTLDWPLFSGGSVAARMEEARAVLAANEARLSQARRRAGMDLASAKEDRAASLERQRLYTEAQTLAEENFKSQRVDYRLGLSTNLEVLEALRDLHEARRNLERARVQAALDGFHLRLVSGAPLFDGGTP